MKRKIVAAILVGFVLGLGVGLVGRQPVAEAQDRQVKNRWEYKVIESSIDVLANPEANMTKQFNELADKHWEYVGAVAERKSANGAAVAVLFKRVAE